MLTEAQKRVLDFVQGYTREHGGVSPNLDEIRDYLGVRTKGAIVRLLNQLEDRGYIRRLRHRSRAIEIIRHATPRYAVFRFDDELKELVPYREQNAESDLPLTRAANAVDLK